MSESEDQQNFQNGAAGVRPMSLKPLGVELKVFPRAL